MIKHKSDIDKALADIRNFKTEVSYVFDKPSFNDGVLNGATFTLKDLIATRDAKTQGSTKILEDFNPKYDATIVKKIKQEGGAIIAKVHSDELGLAGTGQYSAYGKIYHPKDKNRIIGGSSSGSVATFTNNVSIAIGTDTGDSVRLPASYNGIIGFKPSYGAISRYGIYQYASSLDTVALFGHNVSDIATTASVLYGKDELDMTSKDVEIKGVSLKVPKKIAVLKDTNNLLNSKIKEDFNKLIEKLKAKDIVVEEVEVDFKLLDSIDTIYSIISYSEATSNDSNLTGISFGKRVDGKDWEETMIKTRSKGFGEMVQRRFTLGAYFLSNENQSHLFLRAQKIRRVVVEAFNKIYNNYDLLLFPSSDIAPLVNEAKVRNWISSYLISNNLSGTPSISLPFSTREDMPFGISLSSKLYSDKDLLSYSLFMEELLGGEHE